MNLTKNQLDMIMQLPMGQWVRFFGSRQHTTATLRKLMEAGLVVGLCVEEVKSITEENVANGTVEVRLVPFDHSNWEVNRRYWPDFVKKIREDYAVADETTLVKVLMDKIKELEGRLEERK